MAKDAIRMSGVVKKTFTSQDYEVELENGIIIRGKTSGKVRQNRIRILPGDHVDVELSPYDLTRGRITYRR